MTQKIPVVVPYFKVARQYYTLIFEASKRYFSSTCYTHQDLGVYAGGKEYYDGHNLEAFNCLARLGMIVLSGHGAVFST